MNIFFDFSGIISISIESKFLLNRIFASSRMIFSTHLGITFEELSIFSGLITVTEIKRRIQFSCL